MIGCARGDDDRYEGGKNPKRRSQPTIPRKIGSVTLTVGNVTHATLTYKSADNHDPDGDSTGTTITLGKP